MSSQWSQVATLLVVALFVTCSPTFIQADTPANCTYSDFLGHWDIMVSPVGDSHQNCSAISTPIQAIGLTLAFPNVVTSDDGKTGNWTLIYNQGVEIWIADFVVFWFAGYDQSGDSFCSKSQEGWVHPMVAQSGPHWQCLSATKTAAEDEEELDAMEAEPKKQRIILTEDEFQSKPKSAQLYKPNHEFLAQVNAAQSMFTVGDYPEFAGMTVGELQQRRGGLKKINLRDTLPPHAHHKKHARKSVADIPASWDWRSVNGTNYMSPIRDQGSCGSCYSFASGGMMEARIRIASQLKDQPIISTQDIVSCSPFSQGCEGGFPYLTAGKYGHDFGLLEEACYPYGGMDSACAPNPQPGCNPQRWMTNEYYYIGGYYGMSTVQLMQEEIMANGPIAVSFEVYDDFQAYTGGVYSHQFTKHLKDTFNPFELTNHVVVIIGWGETTDNPPVPYWIVKNSWGASWGENGYFRILRGSSEPGGECAIESITVSAIPILH